MVTGCSSGIGQCVAIALHERSYRVFATVRKESDRTPLEQRGIESLIMDYDDSESITICSDEVLRRTDDNIYALFNNGAFGQPGACEDLSREALREQFESNFFGWVELTNRLIPSMRRNGRGRIIQNSSILGFAAMPMRGAYNASKFAIEGFSDTLRLELKGSGVHVSLIEPGPILSSFRANAYKKFLQHINTNDSVHGARYSAMIERFEKEGQAVPFTLPPEAVLKRVIHALESKRPKIRYPVTVPTYFFAWAQRFLSARMLDRLLARVG
ncbi:MAG: SDR family NAD(P)-dependent oxidoreductase [Pseudomonadota bacterium]